MCRVISYVVGGGCFANICWVIEKVREFQRKIYFCFIDYTEAFDYVDHNKLWNILNEMGISLRNLSAGQKAIVRTGHGTKDWFKIGKEERQGFYIVTLLI